MKKIAILLFSFVLILVGNTGQASAEAFTDVKPSDSFYKHMMFLHEKGVIQGNGKGQFNPNGKVTRGDAALMIARALDLDTTQRNTRFPDVSATAKASGAIASAEAKGIIKGYTDGRFGLYDEVTRGQMAIFIARAFELELESVKTFPDVPIDKSSYSAVRKIVAFGVTEGYTTGKFEPDEHLKRSHFSAFLARAMNDTFRLPANVCEYDPKSMTNPDRQTVNCLLTTAALQSDEPVSIPPEVVKAVAIEEKGDWQHFVRTGEPYISTDDGIGLMQITDTTGFDVEKLKYDLTYNIEAGVKVLKNNFTKTSVFPTVGNKSPDYLENWYFAIMGYNGAVADNSPFFKETGNRNPGAYQEKVYGHLVEFAKISPKISAMEMNVDDFHYGTDTNWNIIFKKTHIPVSGAQTISTEGFGAGDKVNFVSTGRLREKPSAASTVPFESISNSAEIEIVGGPLYDQNRNSVNTFVWYPAKVKKDGKTLYGYISSNNIKPK